MPGFVLTGKLNFQENSMAQKNPGLDATGCGNKKRVWKEVYAEYQKTKDRRYANQVKELHYEYNAADAANPSGASGTLMGALDSLLTKTIPWLFGLFRTPSSNVSCQQIPMRNYLVWVTLFLPAFSMVFAIAQGPNVPVSNSGTPTKEELIWAVRQSVQGKTYTEVVTAEQSVDVYCTSTDVRYKYYGCESEQQVKYQERRQVRKSNLRDCPTLTSDPSSWTVKAVTGRKDEWDISLGGSTWRVVKFYGGSQTFHNIKRVSNFFFDILARQDC